MATLDDKLLGEKLHYYCSSSEEDDRDSDKEDGSEEKDGNGEDVQTEAYLSKNTGPKGVLEDWQRYKHLKREQRNDAERELIRKFASATSIDRDLESEEFLSEYRKKRMAELSCQVAPATIFGKVVDLKSGDEFLKAIDEEGKNTLIIVHVYDRRNKYCVALNEMLPSLSRGYTGVKFCKMAASTAGLSLNFKASGVPAILVYKNKDLIGNFIRITEDLGDDFCSGDVENFLIEHGFIGSVD